VAPWAAGPVRGPGIAGVLCKGQACQCNVICTRLATTLLNWWVLWPVDNVKLLGAWGSCSMSGNPLRDDDDVCLRLRNTQPHAMHRVQTPYWQLFNAMSAGRLLRVALHHERSRTYLISVSQITPVLVHFGSLVVCFLYFAAVVAMELLAKEPEMLKVPSSSWRGRADDSVYVNKCKNDLPNFDCPSSALITMFMMFTGTHGALQSPLFMSSLVLLYH